MVANVVVRTLQTPRSYSLNPADIDNALDIAAASILNANRLRLQQGRNTSGQPFRQSQRARETGATTLVETGSLLRSLTVLRPQIGGEVNARIITVDPTATNTRTGVPVLQYARAHQLGLGGLPVRRFLGIAGVDRTNAARVFFSLLRDAVRLT